jgi:hypothetical protein
MHFTFATSMRLGQFSWMTHTAIIGNTLLVLFSNVKALTPGWVWDTLTKYMKKSIKSDVTIYYVDHCYWSYTAVKLLKSFFLFSDTRVTPLSQLNAFDEESQGKKYPRNTPNSL